jgi:CelD/BcsL family acetyltransferase involved in cellulose biosynthesis
MEQFFGAMTHRFQDLGRDAYYVARLGNQIVGTLFAIHFGPWIGYYNGSFDIQHKELSIGTLLIEAMFRHAIEHGFKELDMLAGSSSYKHRWAQCRGERLEYAALPRARLKCLPFTIWETIKSHSRCRA